MPAYLDFERPVAELDRKIEDLRRRVESGEDPVLEDKIRRLEEESVRLRNNIFKGLTPWQRCLVARHPERPYTLDYVERIFDEFVELHGDRRFGDDPAVVAGFGYLGGRAVAVVGHQKGRTTKERIRRNFGQPHPEGYRKALRVMKLAERFSRPVVTLIDTPGAYPGVGAEERGQGEAIAMNLLELAGMKIPVVSVVIGEGGSGGALALGVGDRVCMLENAVYSVISPEGCAAILWKKAAGELGREDYERAAAALKMTSGDLMDLGVVDEVVKEPPGGAHSDVDAMAAVLKTRLLECLVDLDGIPVDRLLKERYLRLRKIGDYLEEVFDEPMDEPTEGIGSGDGEGDATAR